MIRAASNWIRSMSSRSPFVMLSHTVSAYSRIGRINYFNIFSVKGKFEGSKNIYTLIRFVFDVLNVVCPGAIV
jgi:hypothetical protein